MTALASHAIDLAFAKPATATASASQRDAPAGAVDAPSRSKIESRLATKFKDAHVSTLPSTVGLTDLLMLFGLRVDRLS